MRSQNTEEQMDARLEAYYQEKQRLREEANRRPSDASGLSELQKAILCIGNRWQGRAWIDLVTADIKAEYFGWRAHLRVSKNVRCPTCRQSRSKSIDVYDTYLESGTARYSQAARDPGHPVIWKKLFDPEEIGCHEYARVSATISRCLKRLEDRGLLYRDGIGWILTDAGIRAARRGDSSTYNRERRKGTSEEKS
jgi:hypothetical protein